MKEIGFLLEKARENLDVARQLLADAHPDIAASRAYYAMFYVAEALLLKKGMSFSSHAAVIAAYGKHFARTKDLDPKFHQYLILAQSERNLGDYAIGHNVEPDEVEKLLVWGEQFISAANSYLQAT